MGKPTVWEASGNVYYSASALGGCIRGLVAARMGITPIHSVPAKTQTIFNEGHLHESAIVASLADTGIAVTDTQLEVSLHVRDNIYIIGHIDGLIDGDIFEAKSMSQNVFDNWKRAGFSDFYRYAVQLTVYMAATHRKARYYCKNRNTGELDITIVPSPPLPITDIIARVEKVEEWAELDSFPFCDRPSFPCPFYHIHDDNDNPDSPPDDDIPEALDDLLDSLSTEYDKARSLEAQAKARKEMAREKIANILKEGTWNRRGWKVEAQTVSSTKLDQRLAKDILTDLGRVEEAMKTSEHLKITVEPAKKSSDSTKRTGDSPGPSSSSRSHFSSSS